MSEFELLPYNECDQMISNLIFFFLKTGKRVCLGEPLR